MMQMLRAGGMAILSDGVRQPDEDNPRGYFEYEPVKSLRTDSNWLPLAVGKAVKVVHVLIPALPPNYFYRVILMHRRLEDVLASQRKMLARLGQPQPAIPPARMLAAYASQMAEVAGWVRKQPNFVMIEISFEALFQDPEAQAKVVAGFCGAHMNTGTMAAQISPDLYRNRPCEGSY